MKYILIILLFICSVSQAQTNGFQSGKFTIAINRATTNISQLWTSAGNIDRVDVRNGTVVGQGTLLLTSINRYFFWFNALPVSANITQTGTTGAWTIAIPTTATTNKGFFIPDKFICISYAGTKYGFNLTNEIFPVHVKLLVNGEPTGATACTIYADGTIYWPDTSTRTPTAIGTSGLTNYFIN
jgi:hypothetical protein